MSKINFKKKFDLSEGRKSECTFIRLCLFGLWNRFIVQGAEKVASGVCFLNLEPWNATNQKSEHEWNQMWRKTEEECRGCWITVSIVISSDATWVQG